MTNVHVKVWKRPFQRLQQGLAARSAPTSVKGFSIFKFWSLISYCLSFCTPRDKRLNCFKNFIPIFSYTFITPYMFIHQKITRKVTSPVNIFNDLALGSSDNLHSPWLPPVWKIMEKFTLCKSMRAPFDKSS